jgi:hypothetical protein
MIGSSTLVVQHIPKTAGISLRVMLKEVYKNASILEWVDETEFPKLSEEERARFDLVTGHFHYGLHEFIPRPCVNITLLREPVDRVISFFFYVKRDPNHYLWQHGLRPDTTLREFMERRHCIEVDNFQTRLLNPKMAEYLPFGGVSAEMRDTALNNLRNGFDAVGVTERFDDFARLLRTKFGWPEAASKSLNVTANRPRKDEVDEETLDLVRQANQYDTEIYEEAKRVFERQFKCVCGDHSDSVDVAIRS